MVVKLARTRPVTVPNTCFGGNTVPSRWLASRADPREASAGPAARAQGRCIGCARFSVRSRRRRWLRSPNAELDWRQPLEWIAEGHHCRVEAAILAIAEGVTRQLPIRDGQLHPASSCDARFRDRALSTSPRSISLAGPTRRGCPSGCPSRGRKRVCRTRFPARAQRSDQPLCAR